MDAVHSGAEGDLGDIENVVDVRRRAGDEFVT
jgi:hypothetical protein